MNISRAIRSTTLLAGPSNVRGVWHLNLAMSHLYPALFVALLLTPGSLAAQYAIDWSAIAGGGGTSTGSGYKLCGTVGQVDAGTMSGGPFTLTGGFWSMVEAVQTPGAPRLNIWCGGGLLKIAWAKPAEGWVLESTPALSATALNWTPVSQGYQDDGTDLYVTFTVPPGSSFFRLHKP